VRRRLDDRLGALARIPRLEDPRADEDAVRAELHAERGVGGSCDPTGGEGHNRQAAVFGDPAHELDGSLDVLRLAVELVRVHCSERLIAPNTERMWVTALTMSPVPASPFVRIIAAPSAIRRSASPMLVQPQTNGTVNFHLSM